MGHWGQVLILSNNAPGVIKNSWDFLCECFSLFPRLLIFSHTLSLCLWARRTPLSWPLNSSSSNFISGYLKVSLLPRPKLWDHQFKSSIISFSLGHNFMWMSSCWLSLELIPPVFDLLEDESPWWACFWLEQNASFSVIETFNKKNVYM